MVAAGLLTIVMLAATQFLANLEKSVGYYTFLNKKEQLRSTILGQVLNNPNNCKCMFNGATEFPAAGISELIGYTTPTALGVYIPSDCSGGVAIPFVNNAGMDGLKLNSVKLKNILPSAVNYKGELSIELGSTKSVLGPQELHLNLPVVVKTTPGSPGHLVFDSCSTAAGGELTNFIFTNPPQHLLCFDDYSTIMCGAGFGPFPPLLRPSAPVVWTLIDLPAITLGAKRILLQVNTCETSIYLRPQGSTAGVSIDTLVLASSNETCGSTTKWITLQDNNNAIELYGRYEDPSSNTTRTILITLLGYL